MKLFGAKYFKEHFNFTQAGRWLAAGTIIGVISGCAAIVFQLMLSAFRELTFNHWMGLEPTSAGGETSLLGLSQGNYTPLLVLLIPMLGGLLSGWIVYTFAPEAEGHGTDEVIKSYHRKRGIIRPRVSFVKMISSVITIGSGGSGGREGPIAQIGAGFGSYLAIRLGLNTRNRRWFMAAGMGAGIGSIFHAPLAGALFATEVMYSDPELESSVLVPASVSSIVAYSVYSMVFGWEHILLEPTNISFNNPLELLPYLVLAIILALAANVYVKVFYSIQNFFKNLNIKNYLKPAIGGLLTGAIGLLLITATGDKKYVVDVLGGGYGVLQEVITYGNQHISIWIMLVIAIAKILTTSLSIGSGGSGGVFGPSMVIGGLLGAAIGHLIYMIDPHIIANPIAFTIVGMAGFFAAAANTPLSTIIMVSELMGNYELLLPTTWVCTIAYFVGKKWSIYKSQVPNANYSQAHFGTYAPDIVQVTSVGDTYKRDRKISVLTPETSVSDILDIVDRSRQRIFPVVDSRGQLIGGFSIDDITHFLHDQESEIQTAAELMYDKIPVVTMEDNLAVANQQINDHMTDEALVIESSENRLVKGLISSSDIVLTYNRKLGDIKYGDNEPSNTEEVDKKLLNSFSLKSILENDLECVHPDDNLGSLVQHIVQSERNLFPVVDDDKHLHGIILLNDIRKIMFDVSKYDTVTVKSLMIKPPAVIHSNEKMKSIIEKFEHSKAWNLPVVDRKQHYIGIVSKSRIFTVYRNALIEHTEIL